MFTEDDLEWARFIERLRVSDMPVNEICDYIEHMYIHREIESTILEMLRQFKVSL